MLGIKFIGRSLLLGYSIHWCIVSAVFPTIQIPDIRGSKNPHILTSLPLIGKTFTGASRQSLGKQYNGLVSNAYRLIILGAGIYYHIMMVIYGLRVQGSLLAAVGMTNVETLAYKTEYYTPILHKTGLLATVIIMLCTSGPNEWYIYDKYECFSVSERMQIRLVCFSFLVGLADGLIAHYETDSLIHFGPKMAPHWIKLVHGWYYSNENLVGFCLNTALAVSVLVFYIVRYKPLLNMIYSALCISHHLAYINRRLIPLSCRIKRSSLARTSPSSISDQKVGQLSATSCLDIEQKQLELEHSRSNALINDSIRLQTIRTNLESSPSSASYYRGDDQSSPSSSHRLSSAINLIDSRSHFISDSQLDLLSTRSSMLIGHPLLLEVATCCADPGRLSSSLQQQQQQQQQQQGHQTGTQLTEINNLHQLETHITRLGLFVGEIDRCNGAVVFFMCLLNLIQFIYWGFFLVDVEIADPVRAFVSTLFTLSRLSLPVYLFICGNSVEQEAKLMITQLETIYLQDPANNSIYERYSGAEAMRSLARIIRCLQSMQFSCDGLMSIDLNTLKSFVVQSVTFMFIVIQYDAMNGNLSQEIGRGGASQPEMVLDSNSSSLAKVAGRHLANATGVSFLDFILT